MCSLALLGLPTYTPPIDNIQKRLYSKSMPAGRPRLYKNAKQLQKAVDEYWEGITNPQDGTLKEPPTVTGLALALGFADRRSFYDYEQNGEFSYTIKRARTQVENFAEQRLYSNSPAGAIFALKNFGWSDKQEMEHSGPGGTPIENKIIVEFVRPDETTATE